MPNIDVNPNTLYVHHHLGLGDHIICNGLVRFLLKQTNANDLWLVVKRKNLNNVSRMFLDDSRIKFIPVDEDKNFYELPLEWSNVRLARIGFERCRETDFDVSFYDSTGIPFTERWNSWYYQRDLECEQKMMQELLLPEKFVLVHDTSSVGIFDLKINTNLPVIRVSRLNNEKTMFDWIGVIERATEIHCIDSSFIHLVNSVDLVTDSLFYHKIKSSKMQICFRKNWSVIEY
jgi:hypothetical protein